MVKVKDTATFIQRARDIHGDRYDYSQTIYVSTRAPILIVCRQCGPFVLANADSHYRPSKRCGCRTCEIEFSLESKGRARRCSICRSRMKYCGANRVCSECRPWFAWAGAESNRTCRALRKQAKLRSEPWLLWAKNKAVILNNRTQTEGGVAARGVVGNWDKWSSVKVSKLRAKECEWTQKCRRWARSLSRRRLADEN